VASLREIQMHELLICVAALLSTLHFLCQLNYLNKQFAQRASKLLQNRDKFELQTGLMPFE
jgi:hypothetical protein